MQKGDKVKIWEQKWGRKEVRGVGIYLGTEKVFLNLPHGFVSRDIKKFKINGHIVTELECEWSSLK